MLNHFSLAEAQYSIIVVVIFFEILLYIFYFKKSFPWKHGLSSMVIAGSFALSNFQVKPLEHKFYRFVEDFRLFLWS